MSGQAKNHGIVVGVDGSPASNAAICWGARDAVMRHIPLTETTAEKPMPCAADHSTRPGCDRARLRYQRQDRRPAACGRQNSR